jgi:hypothetical protein
MPVVFKKRCGPGYRRVIDNEKPGVAGPPRLVYDKDDDDWIQYSKAVMRTDKHPFLTYFQHDRARLHNGETCDN